MRVHHTIAFQYSENLVAYCNVSLMTTLCLWRRLRMRFHTSHDLHLRNTVRVSQHNTNLRRCGALPCELADLVDDLFGCGFEPSWRGARVWNSTGTYAFAVTVEATHI